MINDVIMSDADCTPGREPRTVAASFRSVCLYVCLSLGCAEFFSAVFDPISIKLGYILYVWV